MIAGPPVHPAARSWARKLQARLEQIQGSLLSPPPEVLAAVATSEDARFVVDRLKTAAEALSPALGFTSEALRVQVPGKARRTPASTKDQAR